MNSQPARSMMLPSRLVMRKRLRTRSGDDRAGFGSIRRQSVRTVSGSDPARSAAGGSPGRRC